jgi:hypothetical protein
MRYNLTFFCVLFSSDSILWPFFIQSAAEITPTFQRGITNKWYEVSPKTFYFPNVDITNYCRFSKLYRPNGGRDGRYTFGTVLLEWPPLVGPRTEDDV